MGIDMGTDMHVNEGKGKGGRSYGGCSFIYGKYYAMLCYALLYKLYYTHYTHYTCYAMICRC
jgi:hypothetical protein